MNIEARLEEISKKIKELDSLIEDTLDNDPLEDPGSYGRKIIDLFEEVDAAWIEPVIGCPTPMEIEMIKKNGTLLPKRVNGFSTTST